MARHFSRIGEIITLLAEVDRRLRGRSIEKLGGRFAGSSREGGQPRWIQRSEA